MDQSLPFSLAAPVHIHTHVNTNQHTETCMSTHSHSGGPQRTSKPFFILSQGGAAEGPYPLCPCTFAFVVIGRGAPKVSYFSEDLAMSSSVPHMSDLKNPLLSHWNSPTRRVTYRFTRIQIDRFPLFVFIAMTKKEFF